MGRVAVYLYARLLQARATRILRKMEILLKSPMDVWSQRVDAYWKYHRCYNVLIERSEKLFKKIGVEK